MYEGIGKGLSELFITMFILCCVTVPLGIWKIVDIVIWIIKHVNVSLN